MQNETTQQQADIQQTMLIVLHTMQQLLDEAKGLRRQLTQDCQLQVTFKHADR
ncbi:hypothetical protein [Hymenobacter wooponensis]|uniref:hypothetical protein n=1 Tax=Hymenobacter wooponensis TaxID=1525360 RepID=UPI0014367BF0|nr:hypothetical protein [Hymenobacter wooponensis]